MKIVAFSDVHWRYEEISVPDGDTLVFAGDFCGRGNQSEVGPFAEWFLEHPHRNKIMIAGNHDWPLQGRRREKKTLRHFPGVHYLCESGVEIDGVSFYGHPYTPAFCGWAFNLPRGGPELAGMHKAIPSGVDILVTHGPPLGCGDKASPDGECLGDELLAEEIRRASPKVSIHGHIHGGYGSYRIGSTIVLNVSVLDEAYCPANDPVVFDV